MRPVIYGIGTDIVKIDRIRRSLERFGDHFARRVLTVAELLEYPACRQPERFMAKRFAVKEAVVKALGLGFRNGLSLNSIGVGHDAYGKPRIIYEGKANHYVHQLGITESFVSISDEQDHAIAFVILIGEEPANTVPRDG